MDRTTSETEQIAREYLTIWNEREYSWIPDAVAESFVMYDPFAPGDQVPGPPGVVHGPAGLETFIRGVVAGFPDFHVEVLEMLSTDELVLYDGRITMTHEGDFFGIPPTGQQAAFRYMGMITVGDDRVGEHRVYPPLREVAEQLRPPFPAIVPYAPKFVWGLLKFR
jgi:predicted ester cyclase